MTRGVSWASRTHHGHNVRIKYQTLLFSSVFQESPTLGTSHWHCSPGPLPCLLLMEPSVRALPQHLLLPLASQLLPQEIFTTKEDSQLKKPSRLLPCYSPLVRFFLLASSFCLDLISKRMEGIRIEHFIKTSDYTFRLGQANCISRTRSDCETGSPKV